MRYLVLLFLLPLIGFSQENSPKPKSRWYIKAAVGYGTKGLLPQEFTVKSIYPSNTSLKVTEGSIQDMTNNIDSTGQRSLVHDTYSKGFNYLLAFGVKLPSRIGLELGVLWLQGGKIKSHSVIEGNTLLGPSAVMDVSTYSRGLAILPAVTYDFPLGTNWFIQGRFGLSIPIAGAIYHDVELNGPNSFLGNSTAKITSETKPTFSLGINGGLGLHRRLGQHFEIFAGITGQHMSLFGKNLQITRYDLTINGFTINQLNDLTATTYDNEINFVTELNQNSNNTEINSNTDLSKPKDELRVSSPFSNIGFGIGMNFLFGKN